MSTPEQPATPALTRKQLRDIRNTGVTPVITDDPPASASPPVDDAPEPQQTDSDAQSAPEPSENEQSENEPSENEQPQNEHSEAHAPAPVVAAPLPRAATPVAVHDLPGADSSVDLGVTPLTRRQARQQERIRTASVPVITPDIAAAHAASLAAASAEEGQQQPTLDDSDGAPHTETNREGLVESDAEVRIAEDGEHSAESEGEPDSDGSESASEAEQPHERDPDSASETRDDFEPADADPDVEDEGAAEPEQDRAIVHPEFGSELLAGSVAPVELPPSFDQLISRSATGSIGTGNALILSQTPSAHPLVAPVTATGEVLITGTFDLPEGLGSTGHAAGTADGKEVDAVLVDGELPAHSSPTPIAASAAISTVKNGGDIIKPPTPEKGGRLMLTLAITAGVLALALVGVLILAFVTGVF